MFPVVPALLSAALRKWRARVYKEALTAFFKVVDPTQLSRVQREVDKLVSLGPNAHDGWEKRCAHLERKYGRTFASVIAAASTSGVTVTHAKEVAHPPAVRVAPSGAPCVAAEGPPPRLRWGVLGCAGISRKNLVSIAQVRLQPVSSSSFKRVVVMRIFRR